MNQERRNERGLLLRGASRLRNWGRGLSPSREGRTDLPVVESTKDPLLDRLDEFLAKSSAGDTLHLEDDRVALSTQHTFRSFITTQGNNIPVRGRCLELLKIMPKQREVIAMQDGEVTGVVLDTDVSAFESFMDSAAAVLSRSEMRFVYAQNVTNPLLVRWFQDQSEWMPVEAGDDDNLNVPNNFLKII